MDDATAATLRPATASDADALVELWSLLDDGPGPENGWRAHAGAWFAAVVDDTAIAHVPVVEDHGALVATAIGTLETGVPNPWCPRGRVVRLANVVTLPPYRRRGHGTALVDDVVTWARSIEADRVDLSASASGIGLYERCGFVATTAPRMKLVL